jgi:acetate---CoA ligase (ADP-forming) subunit beta
MRRAVVTLAKVTQRAKKDGRTVLTEIESKQVLAAAGIPVAEALLATTAEDAAKAAKKAGFPVVIKIVSPDITHKSDVGGVRVGLESKKGVISAFEEMLDAVREVQPDARIEGVAVQHMAPAGTEVIIGMSKDPQFGPVLMFGLGGVLVEVLKDVAFRIVPLEPRDAHQMVREIKGYPVLEGSRGRDAADIAALESLILKLSEFVEANPQIEELDLNPVFAYPDGAIAVDARIVVSLTPAASPAAAGEGR